eukprot:1146840-Pelagomonas_calceolata.AAC.2
MNKWAELFLADLEPPEAIVSEVAFVCFNALGVLQYYQVDGTQLMVLTLQELLISRMPRQCMTYGQLH